MLVSWFYHHLAVDASGTTPSKLGHKPWPTSTWATSLCRLTLLSLMIVDLEQFVVCLFGDVWVLGNAFGCLPVVSAPNNWRECFTRIIFTHRRSSFWIYFTLWMVTYQTQSGSCHFTLASERNDRRFLHPWSAAVSATPASWPRSRMHLLLSIRNNGCRSKWPKSSFVASNWELSQMPEGLLGFSDHGVCGKKWFGGRLWSWIR